MWQHGVLEVPLFYIAFKRNHTLERRLEELGFKDVNHFQAVDGRKLNLDDLVKNGTIGVRAYEDLKVGSKDTIGLPSMGALGCYLSHAALWEKCVESAYPHIWILEEDVTIREFTKKDMDTFQLALSTPASYCVSPFYISEDWVFHGAHFQLVSKEACVELLKHKYPIEVQVDLYVGHVAKHTRSIRLIYCEAATQALHVSSIQEFSVARHWLPHGNGFYATFLTFVMVLALLAYKGRDCWKGGKGVCRPQQV